MDPVFLLELEIFLKVVNKNGPVQGPSNSAEVFHQLFANFYSMLPIKPDIYCWKMFQDNISIILQSTREYAYLKVRLNPLQELEEKRPKKKLSLRRVDSPIMHQSLIEIKQQSKLIFRLMMQIRRGTGRQKLNPPTIPIIRDQLGGIELQKIIIKQIGRQRLEFRQLYSYKPVKITMYLGQTSDLLGDFILDRKERERREICGVLAEVFMVVGQEKGTQWFFCDLFVDERIEVKEVFGEVGVECLVLAELAAQYAFNNQKKEHALEVDYLLDGRLSLLFIDAQLEITQVAFLLQHVIFDSGYRLAGFPFFQDGGEQVRQMEDVIFEVLYLGAYHLFDHIQIVYFFIVLFYKNCRLFCGFEQLHALLALVVLVDLKLIPKLELPELFVLFPWIFFDGCQLFANTQREREDGGILLVALSLETGQLVRKVLVKRALFLVLWGCVFELFV